MGAWRSGFTRSKYPVGGHYTAGSLSYKHRLQLKCYLPHRSRGTRTSLQTWVKVRRKKTTFVSYCRTDVQILLVEFIYNWRCVSLCVTSQSQTVLNKYQIQVWNVMSWNGEWHEICLIWSREWHYLLGNVLLMISCDLSCVETLRGWSYLDEDIKLLNQMFTFSPLMCVEFLIHVTSDLYFNLYTVLDIEHCDLNIKSNSSSHHTHLYEEERLIVRRGQPFSITLHLKPGSKKFTPGETSFALIVETGRLLVPQWLL